jgi:hypothetical protein
MKEEDIPLLRQQTFDLIQNRLRIENRSFLSDENNT